MHKQTLLNSWKDTPETLENNAREENDFVLVITSSLSKLVRVGMRLNAWVRRLHFYFEKKKRVGVIS